MRITLASLSLALLLGCTASGDAPATDATNTDDEDTAGEDLDYPDIQHDAIEGAQVIGQDLTLSARVSDDSGVLLVKVYFRRQTAQNFSAQGMILVDPETGLYQGTIPGDEMGSAGMHYYLEAVDTQGNVGTLPEGAPADYYKFNLIEEAQ
ncbi:hypothetical protein L6R49_16305 [Myxococcota bacterium]|nr:hypothetical protein [Myxococcota bacterium]